MKYLWILLIMILGCMLTAQTLYEAHQKEEIEFDIYNFTTNTFNYTPDIGKEIITNYSGMNSTQIQLAHISNIVYKFTDFVIYIHLEIVKLSIEFGYTHPEYDFKAYMNLIIFFCAISILIMLMSVIVPLIALIYLICVGIKKLYIFLKQKLRDNKNGTIQKSKRKKP